MIKVPCRICKQFDKLKPSKLTGHYWCRGCKEISYTINQMVFIRENTRSKNCPKFSTILRRMTKEFIKDKQ